MTGGLNPLFQVGLDVRGRRCLVIGGGAEAEDKSGRLLDAGARLVVVSPEATEALRSWQAGGRLELRRRPYEAGDLDQVWLVMNTVRGDKDLCDEVFAACRERGILINTYDDAPRSHFGMGALVAAGPLRISVSTSNASPSLSRRLRQDLEGLFGPEFAEYLTALGRVREHVRRTVPDFEQRRRILGSLVEGARLEGAMRLPGDWQERVRAVLEAG